MLLALIRHAESKADESQYAIHGNERWEVSFFIHSLSLTPFLNLVDQVLGSVNTLEEVAASNSKDEYVGKRKAGEVRKEEKGRDIYL